MESQVIEYKSLQKITTNDGMKELAKTCVCMANAQGGVIAIGIDDRTHKPPAGQKILLSTINELLPRLRSQTYAVGLSHTDILTDENGGEYFEIKVFPSQKTVATTSDGKIYIRIADRCEPVNGDDLLRIVAEKDAYQWELVVKNVSLKNVPTSHIRSFLADIRQSDRVKDSVKERSDIEILEHYNLLDNGFLTNLGVLFLGNSSQRARISYPITVQYIVYDGNENKTRKVVWDDYMMSPKELLYEIEKEAIELNYSYEFPDGLFRTQIRYYSPDVIRELLINAFAHRSYLISSDITLEVYPDRFTITSPGGLPMGITSDNILHEKHRRNPHLIKVLHDLKLMEGEGSGYDLIYERLSADAKPFPVIESDFNKVAVTIESKIIDLNALRLTDYISRHFQLNQREKILVGIVARHKKVLSTELTRILQLAEDERLKTWYQNLVEEGVLVKQGKGKGNAFLINPKILADSKLNVRPSLKTVEPHVLEQLILEDIKIHPNSSIAEVVGRIKEVTRKEVQKIVYKLAAMGKLETIGSRTYRKYHLTEKKRK